MRALITRVDALERERNERAAGGDGGSMSSTPDPPCRFNTWAGVLMFWALSSTVAFFEGYKEGQSEKGSSEVQVVGDRPCGMPMVATSFKMRVQKRT